MKYINFKINFYVGYLIFTSNFLSKMFLLSLNYLVEELKIKNFIPT